MQYYQADFLKDNLPIENVKLFIASPPMAAYDNICLLMGKILSYMRPDGTVLIDRPAGYNEHLVTFYHLGKAAGWQHCAKAHVVKAPYAHQKDQWFRVFTKESDRLPVGISQTTVRDIDNIQRSHSHEFNPTVIRELIEVYTGVGDVVLDGFCGTGCVPAVAEHIGRVGVGVDIREASNLRRDWTDLGD